MNKWHIPGIALVCIVIILTGCTKTAAAELTPITVQLSWTHQAQFAGLYAADQNGYYTAEGLAVSFIEGGPGIQSIDSVLGEEVQFGVGSGDQMVLWRAASQPTRAIAVIYRRSPRVFIALADSRISKPQDFVGKTISVGIGGRPLLDLMTKKVGIQPDQYTVVESVPGLDDLYSGKVQVRSVFLNNEVLTARAAGYTVNVIYPDDYGIHFYADTLFTTEDLIASHPDLVLRFLRATLKGWTFAVENPTAVGALVQKYNPDADPGLEFKKMTASLPLVNTGEDFIGWMKPEIWAGMEATLREQGVLTVPLDVTQVYTLQFIEEIYGK